MTDPATGRIPRRRRRSGKTILVGGLLVALLLSLTAVAYTIGNRGPSSEVSIGLIAEPQDLDIRSTAGTPLDQILIDNVYQGLIGLEPGSIDEYRPVLATSLPEVRDDGRTYVFELRDGVSFHSGSPLEPEDVVDSLTAGFSGDALGEANSAEVSAEGHTITITLRQPDNQLMWYLAGRPGLVFESGDPTELAEDANGTGPFVFDEWLRDDRLTLTRNEDYWGPQPAVDTAVFRFFTEGRDAVNALKEGDLDVHTALLPTLRPEFESSSDFSMVRAESSDIFTLGFNTNRPPLDDPKVRTALSRAIDPEALIKSQNGDGKPIGGPITELEPGYEDLTDINAYDPDSARELLEEAGHAGLSLTLTAPEFYDQAPIDLITSQLADVGVSVNVKTVGFSTWLEEVYTNHDYQLSYIDHAEARDFDNYADPGYYFGYDEPRVQELYARSLAAPTEPGGDEPSEGALLAEAARLVAEDAPAKWLYNYTPTNVIGSHVSGFPTANTNARISLEAIRLSE